jgi:Zn-dependent M28 family amino/carboxypeptidase
VLLALLLAFAAGCGESDSADAADAAVALADAGGPDGAPACTGTMLECATWIQDYQRHVVGSLAGTLDIEPGVRLNARESESERDTARRFLVRELEALGLDVSLHNYGTGANVVVTLAATEPNARVVVMGAHFDGVAVGPAAADNATGVALVMSAARFFAQHDTRTHTLLFVLFDEEEIGLVGSEAFAAKLVDDATDVQAVHNFDMISWDSDLDGALEVWSPASELLAQYQAVGAELSIPVASHTFEYSDHQSFLDQGFRSIGVSEEFVGGDFTPHYHEATDSFDKIDFDFLESITRMVLTVVGRTPTAQ